MDDSLQIALAAAKLAGDVIRSGFEKKHEISEKENKSIVTETDKNAEDVIIKLLEEKSKFPILSEETRSTLPEGSTYWAVDPLDGTTNFARKIPFFAVSIALIQDNQPVVGVIYNPATQELFSAEKGKGAFLNGNKIVVNDLTNVIFVNTGYNEEHRKKYAQATTLAAGEFTIRKMGSTACELAMIAKGAADGFICWGDSLWDHAAGILLVREAGGMVTDWKGTEWNASTNYVLATNSQIHPKLLTITTTL